MSGPPDADPAVIAPADPADRPPRFRWRLLPTIGCGLAGAGSLLQGGSAFVLFLSYALDDSAWVDWDEGYFWRQGFLATAGLLWLLATPMWWRGRRRWAWGLSLAGLAFFAASRAV